MITRKRSVHWRVASLLPEVNEMICSLTMSDRSGRTWTDRSSSEQESKSYYQTTSRNPEKENRNKIAQQAGCMSRPSHFYQLTPAATTTTSTLTATPLTFILVCMAFILLALLEHAPGK